MVIQPSAVYNKYLRDLWYSAKILDNTITFSLSHIEKSLSFDRDIFASIIGLEYSKEYVSFPDHEAMKNAIATLGADDLFDIAGVLYDDLISKLTTRGKKGREKNICYTRYLSLKPTSSKVPLTSHTRKVAKLDDERQVTLSEGANIETSGAMSLSGTSEHPSSVQKAKPNKKRRVKKTSSSSEPNALKDVSPTPILQTFESQHAEGTKEQDNVVTEEINMGDDGTEFDTADENPFDTELEIKFVKSYNPFTDNEEPLFTSNELDTEEDSELASIPDDEIGSPSAFQTFDTKESLSEPKLSKSEEKYANNVLDELTDLRASTDKPSESISHIKEEIISLSTKIGQMESNITKKVSKEV
ncbi:hypothetical protein Tco_0184759 [Tanacetum coccineum]